MRFFPKLLKHPLSKCQGKEMLEKGRSRKVCVAAGEGALEGSPDITI
jgi:hypothetical protein